MRQVLDKIYVLSGLLGAFFLASILVIVLAQVLLTLVDRIIEVVAGAPVGLLIPSYADFAGYFLAAGTFFALAHTFHAGAHIRVNLALQRFPARARHRAEIFCCVLALAASGYFTFYAARLTHESWEFGDLSPGLVPIPIWLPQTAMTLGLVMLTIAAADVLIQILRGQTPAYEQGEAPLDMMSE